MAHAVRTATRPVERGARRAAELARLLSQSPWEFDLFQAMRMIEAAHPDRSRIGESRRPVDDPVRFAQEASLAFAPAAVAAFEASGEGAPRLVQRVLGLLGPNGALPIHLTEWTRERARHHGDAALLRFLDVFHHRILSLFYRAWAQAQPAVSLDRPRQDYFGRRLAALCGLGAPTLRNRDSAPDFVKLAHAGVFGRQVRSAECLQIVLANYFAVPVRIEEFVGHWLSISPQQHSRLGRRDGFARLSEDAVIGSRTWHAQSRFRVVLGPLSFRDYERFLPPGKSSRALHDLVKLNVGVEYSWEVKLVLRKNEVPLAWLGNSVWIGWSSWLGARLTDKDAADYCETQHQRLPHWDAPEAKKEAQLVQAAPEPEPQLVQ